MDVGITAVCPVEGVDYLYRKDRLFLIGCMHLGQARPRACRHVSFSLENNVNGVRAE